MPWREPTVVELRQELVRKHLREGISVSEVASSYGISRKTAYKWIERFTEQGGPRLEGQSSAPRHCPHAIAGEVAEILLEARRKHPSWGPRKILAWLERRHTDLNLPAASTVGDLYRRQGLSRPRRRVHGPRTKLKATTYPLQPNTVWSLDYKGHFRTTNWRYCYPLTIVDGYSRYLLEARALDSTCHRDARHWIERCFCVNGLPEVMRTDNGIPFALPQATQGLSRLTVWWTRLGIRHERIEPGHPEQNGAHERMHKTLKAETVRPPASCRSEQQRRLDSFRSEYNFERPHEALENQTPSDLWKPSPRSYPKRLPLPQYPSHFEVRPVSCVGSFKFGGEVFFVGRALHGQYVGLEEVDNDLWLVYYFSLRLRQIQARNCLRLPPAALKRLAQRYLLASE